MRKTDDNLSKILRYRESQMWKDINSGQYSWLIIKSDKKKKLYRLIDIYTNLNDLVEKTSDLNKKVDEIEKLKDAPIDED